MTIIGNLHTLSRLVEQKSHSNQIMVKQKTLFSFFQKKDNDKKHVIAVVPTIPVQPKTEQDSSEPPSPLAKNPGKQEICEDVNSDTADATPLDGYSKTIVSDEERSLITPSKDQAQAPIENKRENHNPKTTDENSHLSEYEKLRLRNIKRNHDRLVALGLIEPSAECLATSSDRQDSSQRQSKKRKKANKIKNASTTLPLRRSVRNRNMPVDMVSQEKETVQQQLIVEKEEDDEEQFKDSPLVQYSMQSDSTTRWKSSTPQLNDKLSSFVPTGPRLLSPKANLAIYSLDIFTTKRDAPIEWVVGAGKSGIISIWNCSNPEIVDNGLDPIISWKSHGGRWVADAMFSPSSDLNSSNATNSSPFHLLTAANDGKVCLWDVRSLSCNTGAPRKLATTGSSLHTGGIFSMHTNSEGSNYSDVLVCTGSKDKTLAVSTLESITYSEVCRPIFVSRHHTSKVGCVQLQGHGSSLIGSASDDGSIAVHDFRSQAVVTDIDFAHDTPHSIVWDPYNSHSFISAGHDPTIHSWDLRNLKEPQESYHGHVPLTTKKCKRIHRPCIFKSIGQEDNNYILSGSEKSGCLSIFQPKFRGDTNHKHSQISVYSRGYLPDDCGDAGCVAVHGSYVAVAVDGGEILVLEPRSSKDESSQKN